MSKTPLKALLWGLAVALYLQFGLEPTGWLFYEATFALGVDWLYWGYSIFRGAGYALSLWAYHTVASLAVGLVTGLIILWRTGSKESS